MDFHVEEPAYNESRWKFIRSSLRESKIASLRSSQIRKQLLRATLHREEIERQNHAALRLAQQKFYIAKQEQEAAFWAHCSLHWQQNQQVIVQDIRFPHQSFCPPMSGLLPLRHPFQFYILSPHRSSVLEQLHQLYQNHTPSKTFVHRMLTARLASLQTSRCLQV